MNSLIVKTKLDMALIKTYPSIANLVKYTTLVEHQYRIELHDGRKLSLEEFTKLETNSK